MFLFIIITFKWGIGLGIYPNGFLSAKYFLQEKTFIQLTIGMQPYYSKYIYEETYLYKFGIKAGYELFKGGTDYYEHLHFIGAGTGIHIKKEVALIKTEIIPITEICYECNLFPNKKFAIAVEPNFGINIIKIKEIKPFVGGGGYFYFK